MLAVGVCAAAPHNDSVDFVLLLQLPQGLLKIAFGLELLKADQFAHFLHELVHLFEGLWLNEEQSFDVVGRDS